MIDSLTGFLRIDILSLSPNGQGSFTQVPVRQYPSDQIPFLFQIFFPADLSACVSLLQYVQKRIS